MGCLQTLDFQTPPVTGAHLSFYWTMDEGGALPRLDSTVGLSWPLVFGATSTPGLFSNGVDVPPSLVLTQNPGLRTLANASITINQATSTGLSVWFWIKLVDYRASGIYFMDTSDVLHTNRFKVSLDFVDALNGIMEVEHTNDTDDVFADTPNLTWALGAWHMVAITYDKTIPATLNIYIDGLLSATVLDPFVYPDMTSANMIFWHLGGPFTSPTGEFIIDEFGLSTKGALTPTQITSLYNSGAGVTWPNITPIVPYP